MKKFESECLEFFVHHTINHRISNIANEVKMV